MLDQILPLVRAKPGILVGRVADDFEEFIYKNWPGILNGTVKPEDYEER